MSTAAGTIAPDGKCNWCGNYHGVRCPEVRAIEYHPDGSVKRVEYLTPADHHKHDWSMPIDSPNLAYTR